MRQECSGQQLWLRKQLTSPLFHPEPGSSSSKSAFQEPFATAAFPCQEPNPFSPEWQKQPFPLLLVEATFIFLISLAWFLMGISSKGETAYTFQQQGRELKEMGTIQGQDHSQLCHFAIPHLLLWQWQLLFTKLGNFSCCWRLFH